MNFSRWVFRIAGIYGLLVLAPQYFMEEQIGQDQQLPISNPEYFYGFIGVALAWQLAFLVISLNPRRYRLVMLPAIVEKLSFGVAALVLFANERINRSVFLFSCVDLVLAVLFAWAYWLTGENATEGENQ
jgi:hypothetical protein